ncbi:MAG: hypothetical protein DWQ09_18150 [Proteobacteria bacterium]|nr:MAG: hypothetical protein DWQ09_18150 [Pseudomonadota bacterium]
MPKKLLLAIALIAASPLTADATSEPQQCQTFLCPTGQTSQSSTCPVNQPYGQSAGCLDMPKMISDMVTVACSTPFTVISWFGQLLSGAPSDTTQ